MTKKLTAAFCYNAIYSIQKCFSLLPKTFSLFTYSRIVNIQYNPQTQKFENLSSTMTEVDKIGGGDACQVSLVDVL